MKTGFLRTLAVVCGVAVLGVAVGACRSTPKRPRDDVFRDAMAKGFGFSGSLLAVDLGQDARVRLLAPGIRLVGEHLYVEESNHRFNAIRRENLHLSWSYGGFHEPTRYPPTLSTTSFLGMTESRLHQVNLTYGHNQGDSIYFDIAPSAPFVATAGTAFIPSWGGSRGQKTLRTLNLVTGLEGWGWRTPGDIRGAMAIGGTPPRQTVYFATDGGEVYALTAAAADGPAPDPDWVQKTHGAVTADLTLSGDELFVASQDGFLYAMDRITGSIKWAAPHEIPLLRAPVATAGSVYQSRPEGMWCHDRVSGKVRWKVAGAKRFVLERDGKVLLELADGTIGLVDGAGKVGARIPSGGYVYPTNVDGPDLFAVSLDGYVIKLEVGGE